MNILYKTSAAILMVASMSNVAIAGNLILITVKDNNTGISTVDTHVPLSSWKVAFPDLETSPPAGATGLILVKNRKPKWTTTSLKDLNRRYGGEDEGDKKKWGSKTIYLDIMPDDGNWHMSMKRREATGCPKQISTVLASQIMEKQNRSYEFKAPFHPRQLDEQLRRHKWNKISRNTWRSELANIGPETGSKSMEMKVTWQLDVMSETHIKSKAVIQVTLPKALSFALGGSTECVVRIGGDFKHTGK